MSKGQKVFLVVLVLAGCVYGGVCIVATQKENTRKAQEKAAYDLRVSQHPLTSASILNDVNEARHQAGSSLLSMNPDLTKSAEAKCSDMAQNNYYEHARPSDGKKGSDWINENTKYWKVANENLNQGDFQASFQVLDSWLASPSHKAAMLDAKFTDTGIAVCDVLGKKTIVEHFAAYYSQEEISAAQPRQTVVQQQPARRQTQCYTRYNPGMPEYGLNPTSSTSCY